MVGLAVLVLLLAVGACVFSVGRALGPALEMLNAGEGTIRHVNVRTTPFGTTVELTVAPGVEPGQARTVLCERIRPIASRSHPGAVIVAQAEGGQVLATSEECT